MASLARATRLRRIPRRLYATSAPTDVVDNVHVVDPKSSKTREGWLYVDSIFPIRFASWDLRRYIGIFRSETLLGELNNILTSVHTHNFKPVSLDPHHKEGGVFIRFQYSLDKPDDRTSSDDLQRALKSIEDDLREQTAKQGGIPNWCGVISGNVWLVKGHPWREDLARFPSPILRVAFDGPDVQEERLYELLRPYGRIEDIAMPTPPPAGSLRTATISFRRVRSAVVARNVLHGIDVFPSGGSGPSTRLRTAYEAPIKPHVIRDWVSQHPRLAIPVLVSILFTFTYTVFDPIRTYMVQGKVGNWFEFRDWSAYRWLSEQLSATLGFKSHDDDDDDDNNAERKKTHVHDHSGDNVWRERREALDATERYLTDMPSTIAFVHGPAGSGKSRMLTQIIGETNRKALVIDCSVLFKQSTDAQIVTTLASQTGYWPVFSFLNSLNNLIDIASVGLIGQKAGLSSSLTDQLQQVLDVTAKALARVSAAHKDTLRKRAEEARKRESVKVADERIRQRIAAGAWHDGRLDDVAGNGVMSELGVGDEVYGDGDEVKTEIKIEERKEEVGREQEEKQEGNEVERALHSAAGDARTAVNDGLNTLAAHLPTFELPHSFAGFGLRRQYSSQAEKEEGASNGEGRPAKETEEDGTRKTGDTPKTDGEHERKQRSVEDVEAVNALPVVVIKNFNRRAGMNEELLNVVANWAASLVENQIAHVVVVSDNRENSKRIAKALPSKPLYSIALSDADAESALSYVKQKLHDADLDISLGSEEKAHVQRLGGRASDLESLIHKVRNGQAVREAVEDIVRRDVGELRKNAFGDDAEDAKALPWSREQAWTVLKRLAKKDELPYYAVLVDFPFKGDEAALRAMESAELIAIGTDNGKPTTIRPGKPVYKYVFEQVVNDRVFQATQDMAVNDKLIAAAESTVKACEQELTTLKDIRMGESSWWPSDTRRREKYLFAKMETAEATIERLERQNAELKKALSKS